MGVSGRLTRRSFSAAIAFAAGGAAARANPSSASAGPIAALFPGRMAVGGVLDATYKAFTVAAARHDAEIMAIAPVAARIDSVGAALAHALSRGARAIITFGEVTEAPVLEAARAHPHARFAVVQGEIEAANVASYRVDPLPGAYLAGYAASLLTRTGIVGHAGLDRSGPALALRAAFAHGARSGYREPTLLTGFAGSEGRLAAYAQAQAECGADVIFIASDGDCRPAAAAARAAGARAIGFGLDWVGRDPGLFGGSAIADPAMAVREAVTDFARGWFRPNRVHKLYDSAPDARRLTLAPDVPDTVRREVAVRDKHMLNGRLDPPTEWEGVEFEG